jgi:2-aminoadipate transaminase
MFVWVKGPAGMDMESVNKMAETRMTAFVPGTFFFARPGDGRETMRLNYTMANEESLSGAVKTIGEVLQDALTQKQIYQRVG